MYSTIEFNATKEALYLGYRSDGRKFDEPRDLKITCSQSPGFVMVQLGKTMITARTIAQLDVPSTSSPSKGQHVIKVYAPPYIKRSQLDTFQANLRMIWRSINALEEDTLCVKIGEKVWKLTTQVVINDDDGALIDASIIAVYMSLSQICFPSFDTSTGNLYPPSQRRTHKVAFSIRPIGVTVAFINERQKQSGLKQNIPINAVKNPDNNEYDFIEEEEEDINDDDNTNNINNNDNDNNNNDNNNNDNNNNDNNNNKQDNVKNQSHDSINYSLLNRKRITQKSNFSHPKKIILVDPTVLENKATSGYATFIISEHQEQVYINSMCPGSIEAIDEAREAAISASSKWRKVIEDTIEAFNKKYNLEGLPCVGDPADFIDYKPPHSNLESMNPNSNRNTSIDNINEFKLWRGETREQFVIDFFSLVGDNGDGNNDSKGDDSINDGENWLHSSLIV